MYGIEFVFLTLNGFKQPQIKKWKVQINDCLIR
jgi:hypothetical protein